MPEMVSQENLECKSALHCEHLCYIISQGFQLSDPQEYQSLVENPGFRCTHCKRTAGNDRNLCKPEEM